ncbi:Oidioi.mRNA.OKI2018_I69.PAR.g9712.t1.cds [Oikopleura dioica]|uniref:Oidioi.mRNA.OKI2018_I69.PAR.g9712.t1.cds n=1 Tax=Oikopleura dioica TaxID=34765 RepID=A0ABN7RMW6_OIKDI|nr:Oidioi.mRNA.OKI2018_I69.PAR.g9712.t1.cds [Oikopleura dioica]
MGFTPEKESLDEKFEQIFFEIQQLFDSPKRKSGLDDLDQLVNVALDEDPDILKKWTPTVLRLSSLCPIVEVKERMNQVLNRLQTGEFPSPRNARPIPTKDEKKRRRLSGQCSLVPHRLSKGPSLFVTALPEIPIFDEESERLLQQAEQDEIDRERLDVDKRRSLALLDHWDLFHRFDHLSLVTSIHTSYFELWDQFMRELIMTPTDSALTKIERVYIAIMAVSARNCEYLYHMLREEFLHEIQSCQPTTNYHRWLEEGLTAVPEQYQKLAELNELLANKPWNVKAEHINDLTTGLTKFWRDSDLLTAIIIMSWFHCLSGFCAGVGIQPELDSEEGHGFRQPSTAQQNEGDSDSSNSVDKVEHLIKNMKAFNRIRTESQSKPDFDPDHDRELSENSWKHLKNMGLSDTVFSDDEDDEELHDTPLKRFLTANNNNKNLSASRYNHPKDVEQACLRLHEYCWRSTANRACMGSAFEAMCSELRVSQNLIQLIDEKFQNIRNLTYRTVGPRQEVDTEIFRSGIWDYTQCLLSIMSDDCPYHHLEKLIDDEMRDYLKNLVFRPKRVTKAQYDNFLSGLTHDEKVHVNLISLEARFQAELMFSIRAFSEASRQRR